MTTQTPRQDQRVTLRDIAQQVHVSAATVSQALNGKGRMSAQKRQQICTILRRLGHRPKTQRKPVYFICGRSANHTGCAHVPLLATYSGLSEAFRENDLNLHIDFIHTDQPLHPQLENLASFKPGAVVLESGLEDQLEPAYQYFEQQNIPTVQVGHVPGTAACDAISVDNFIGAKMAVAHLAKSHKRIACIRWNSDKDPASREKHSGFTCAMAEAGLPVNPEYVIESPYARTGDNLLPGRVAIDKLITLKERPTAVFVENSIISPSLIYPANARESALPRDIAQFDMVHFETTHLDMHEETMAHYLGFEPRKIKLLRTNWAELGHMTAKRVIERLNGASNCAHNLRVAPRLIALEGHKTSALS